MDRMLRHLRGCIQLEIGGVSMELALNKLTQANIGFWGLTRIDEFTTHLWIATKHLQKTCQLLERAQSTCRVVQRQGVLWMCRGFVHRKLFLVAILTILVSVYALSERVLFIQVEGNQHVSSQLILEELSQLGMGFGTKTATIDPHGLKFEMLVKIPELEWITVTTSGSVATVSVRERGVTPPSWDSRVMMNVVSKIPCLITEISVLSGFSQCKIGDLVAENQMLISAYGDLETSIGSQSAYGEVYGRTWRTQEVVIPRELELKQEPFDTKTRYALVFGKKRINLHQNTGNLGTKCDKIEKIQYLTLWGGYTLPIAWVEETYILRETAEMPLDALVATATLSKVAEDLTTQDMVAGQIETVSISTEIGESLYHLTGTFQCHEMVGKLVPALQFEDG